MLDQTQQPQIQSSATPGMTEPGQDTTDQLGILLVASCPLLPVIATTASPETQLKIKHAEELPLKPGRLYLCWEGESERGMRQESPAAHWPQLLPKRRPGLGKVLDPDPKHMEVI